MILNARALQLDYLPSEMHHRQGQVEHLASLLQPIQHGLSGTNAFIFGPSGTGKTTLARYIIEKLRRQTLDVRAGYVNCIQNSTPGAVLHELLRRADLGTDLPIEGTAVSRYIRRLRGQDDEIVFVIDEVDVLVDRQLLHSLYDINGVTLVLICVDEDTLFADDLDPRIESRLRSMEKLRLEGYAHQELVDILWGRAEAGLRSGSITNEAVNLIADTAAGDARRAVKLLERSVRCAIDDGTTVTVNVVQEVADDVEEAIVEDRAANLGTHQRLLWDIISAGDEIRSAALHTEYERRATDPKSKATRRRYLRSMERYDLIESAGNGPGTRYRVP